MSSIIILEGNSLNISCTPSIPEAVLSWSHSMNNLTQRDGIIFFPPSLNHTLSFEKLKASDSGIYTCRVAIDNPVFKENINLTVIPGKKFEEMLLDCLFSETFALKLMSLLK